jgi:hypothetical protein
MTRTTAEEMFTAIIEALNLPTPVLERIGLKGEDRLPSCFPVSDLAVASVGAACAALAELSIEQGGGGDVEVDYRLASLWFGWSIRPIGWDMPSAWDAIAGDYRATDGWIKLHTNAPHHRAAALSVLKCEATQEAVAKEVSRWEAQGLETDIVAAGGCAAQLRTIEAWKAHPQGSAVAAEPLIIWDMKVQPVHSALRPTIGRPLAGLKVLDLTRVLAGPVATRFLAGYGADVLRIDPPTWDEPGVIPEVTLGKRCARLDLKQSQDREIFMRLLKEADILIHGYRGDALDRLGFGSEARQMIRPGLIDVSLNAYGHSGPWKARRGFDSLVQFSSGIAAAGKDWKASDVPISLPVQALDHATGYLIAAAAVRGLIARRDGEGSIRARLSLARTAKLLADHKGQSNDGQFDPARDADYADSVEQTAWGAAQRLHPPARIVGTPMVWDRPAMALGSSPASWK